jgi:hypothetical protein
MRSPLALLEIDNLRGKPGRVWKVIRSSVSARGHKAYRVVWVRKPTPQDEATVTPCLRYAGGTAHNSQDLFG